jgi:hypothetical protein
MAHKDSLVDRVEMGPCKEQMKVIWIILFVRVVYNIVPSTA